MSPIRDERNDSSAESQDDLSSDPGWQALPVIGDDEATVLPVAAFVPVDVLVTLDSGCTDHVMDAEDAPGYTVRPSPGSRRGQQFTVGNGEQVPNEGEVSLNLTAPAGSGRTADISTNFQVAEITRPLMSVSRICDQGMSVVFTASGAKVYDSGHKEVCQFERSRGLYVSKMQLKPPEPFPRPAP
jgi:hypothetical protein